MRNLKLELSLELNLKLKGYYLAALAAQSVWISSPLSEIRIVSFYYLAALVAQSAGSLLLFLK